MAIAAISPTLPARRSSPKSATVAHVEATNAVRASVK